MADDALPTDPEEEQRRALFTEFLTLGFTQTEAACLAYHWANPEQVAWWLSQGCSYRQAVELAT